MCLLQLGKYAPSLHRQLRPFGGMSMKKVAAYLLTTTLSLLLFACSSGININSVQPSISENESTNNEDSLLQMDSVDIEESFSENNDEAAIVTSSGQAVFSHEDTAALGLYVGMMFQSLEEAQVLLGIPNDIISYRNVLAGGGYIDFTHYEYESYTVIFGKTPYPYNEYYYVCVIGRPYRHAQGTL